METGPTQSCSVRSHEVRLKKLTLVKSFGLAAVTIWATTVAVHNTLSTAVTAAPATVGVIVRGASVAQVAVRTSPPSLTSGVGPGRFNTVPPGSPLLSETACDTKVRPVSERRPANTAANHTVGVNTQVPGVTGNFVGTTDEIIQWVSCKWGIDEDVVRAQIAKESWWRQDAGGDYTTDQSSCHPRVRTAVGTCPESLGLGQVRYPYHGAAFANDNALNSSAYNLDYTYSVWRACFEGRSSWLNSVERGRNYGAGDIWGCLGVWFAGRWYTSAAVGYIASVQELLATRVWETPGFQSG